MYDKKRKAASPKGSKRKRQIRGRKPRDRRTFYRGQSIRIDLASTGDWDFAQQANKRSGYQFSIHDHDVVHWDGRDDFWD